MAAVSSITSVAARALIGAVARLGKPVEALFESSGLDPSAAPDVDHHLAAEKYYELWDQAMQLVQDPAFGVRVGASFDLEELEAFGFLAMACETLRDAYERTAAVRSLYNVGSRWELVLADDCLRMVWMPWPVTVQSEIARRGVNEYQVTEMLTCIRQMTGRRLMPRRIAFRHTGPRDTAVHRELLGRLPDFEADFDGFEAELSWLSEPLRGTNSKLRAYFQKQCESTRDAFSSDPPFTALVRQRLAASMEGGALGMADIARALGTSSRSLHRRLQDEGTSFNELVDQVRRQFAEQYLARPKLAISEVAFLVGFNGPSAFHKAFRRWTGVTPSEYRSTLVAAG